MTCSSNTHSWGKGGGISTGFVIGPCALSLINSSGLSRQETGFEKRQSVPKKQNTHILRSYISKGPRELQLVEVKMCHCSVTVSLFTKKNTYVAAFKTTKHTHTHNIYC